MKKYPVMMLLIDRTATLSTIIQFILINTVESKRKIDFLEKREKIFKFIFQKSRNTIFAV